MIRKYLRKIARFAFPQPEDIGGIPDYINDSAEKRLRRTVFVVEASDHERHLLWADHCKENRFGRKGHRTWKQHNGWLVTVGHFAGFPVCIDITWNDIDGVFIAFWSPCSKVVHHDLIAAWFKKHFTGKWDDGRRRAMCDAQNFHQCLNTIDDYNARKIA